MKLLIAIALAKLSVLGILIYTFITAYGWLVGLAVYTALSILWVVLEVIQCVETNTEDTWLKPF